jgi:hypothetical protein
VGIAHHHEEAGEQHLPSDHRPSQWPRTRPSPAQPPRGSSRASGVIPHSHRGEPV